MPMYSMKLLIILWNKYLNLKMDLHFEILLVSRSINILSEVAYLLQELF